MADRVSLPNLKKEVLPPYKESSGLGVVMVASMAMLFAVTSSALALRARMARQCSSAGVPVLVTQPIVVDWTLPAHTTEPALAPLPGSADLAKTPCGEPSYYTGPDGSVSVFFSVCPDRERPDLSVIRSATIVEPDSVEVHVH